MGGFIPFGSEGAGEPAPGGDGESRAFPPKKAEKGDEEGRKSKRGGRKASRQGRKTSRK